MEFWKSSAAGDGASEAEIQFLEQKYDVRFPADFREYLRRALPTDENMWDDNSSTWWHLNRIKNIPEEYEHAIAHEIVARDAARYIFFADHMIWCSAWAICCDDSENRGRVIVVGGRGGDTFVADSFDEFVDLYIQHDDRLF
jgi:hypothetical protein